MARTMAIVVGAAACAAGMAACSKPSAGDFSTEAEEFLRSDAFYEQYGLDLQDVTCEEPASHDTGATFECIGTDYAFTFEITSSTDLLLRAIEFGGSPPDSADDTATAPAETESAGSIAPSSSIAPGTSMVSTAPTSTPPG